MSRGRPRRTGIRLPHDDRFRYRPSEDGPVVRSPKPSLDQLITGVRHPLWPRRRMIAANIAQWSNHSRSKRSTAFQTANDLFGTKPRYLMRVGIYLTQV